MPGRLGHIYGMSPLLTKRRPTQFLTQLVALHCGSLFCCHAQAAYCLSCRRVDRLQVMVDLNNFFTVHVYTELLARSIVAFVVIKDAFASALLHLAIDPLIVLQ